jgi:hypothetical protein
MQNALTNHDILVAIIMERMGSLPALKEEILRRTGRKYVTRMTIERAFKTAARYVLGNDVYLPTLQVANVGDRVEVTPTDHDLLKRLDEIEGKKDNGPADI